MEDNFLFFSDISNNQTMLLRCLAGILQLCSMTLVGNPLIFFVCEGNVFINPVSPSLPRRFSRFSAYVNGLFLVV